MYKAIKNFEVIIEGTAKQFIIGEEVPKEFVSDRLIRAKKISSDVKIQEDVKNTTEEVQLLVETPAVKEDVEVIIETVKEQVAPVVETPKSDKKKK